ncbi:hypothetical protein E2F43_18010 [Seongchinamella unica]|uniref:Uncharacterized protein n=1 Tax=Seongchinamella unica TaxID=2547392 RepID=A0A4R5LN53_9GAMM|nr:hypothetical protein [Seongchinamella unica]TDG11609.1 hypothetical protein E2F43_18010 [Seongchinamella unica]
MSEAAVDSTADVAETLSNRGFVVALAWAVIALGLSAIIAVTCYLLLSPDLKRFEDAASRGNVKPWKLEGKDLIPRMGNGETTSDNALRITELEPGLDKRAIFSRRARLKAEDYPFLQSQISDLHPDLLVYFIWRTERAPEDVFYQRIYWTGDTPKLQMLGGHPEWRGKITEVGIDAYGKLRDYPTAVESLTFMPNSPANLLRSIWAEWTAVEGWTQKSAHHLRGTPPDPILPVTPVVAAWAGGALIILGLLWLFNRPSVGTSMVLAVAIPWISLDLIWQNWLSTQLKDTRHLFAGKTMHEKLLVDWEGDLYQYAHHLKTSVLPEPGVRIFLLEPGPLRGYRRLKMQYFLLPHNIFNFGQFPRPESVLPGDYLLVLGEVDGLDFDSSHSALTWNGKTLPVERIDQHTLGSLYRYGGGS